MSNSLRPHESQLARPPCPSPTPGVYPNPCSLSWWCHPTISSSVVPFSSCPQSFPASRSFQWVSSLHRWPKYWSFSFSISPSNEYPGLIFRMDWLDLLAVQGSLTSLLQHHSSKTSILQHSAFFIVQLSHPYMTTGKTIALTRWASVWVHSRSLWWTGRPGVLWFMGWQRVGHNWATELNWTELKQVLSIDLIYMLLTHCYFASSKEIPTLYQMNRK